MPRVPTDNYTSRLILTLEEGCKREVRIPFGDQKQAYAFRYQLHTLRSTLVGQSPDWRHLYGTKAYITKEDPTAVVLRPVQGEWKDALDAAGIPDYTAPAPPLTLDLDDLTPAEDQTQTKTVNEYFNPKEGGE